MNKFIYTLLVLLFATIGANSFNGEDTALTLPKENGNSKYDNINIEYDNGTNIVMHVKIAIDKEGWEMRDEIFKTRLKTQWEGINKRFNGLDKKGMLKRNYIFIPDLEDIILYECDDNKKNPANSHWEIPQWHNDRIDRKKYHFLVVYDFAVQEGEGGGGHGDNDGLGNILVINPGKENIGKFYNHEWSEYEMRAINLNGAKKQQYLLYYCMNDWFPDMIEFNVTENGEAVEGYTLKVYKMTNYKIEADPIKTYTFNESILRKNAKEIFWHGNEAWHYYNMVFVEALNNKTGNKGYCYMPAYEVHNQGVIDKFEKKTKEYSVFKKNIEIK